MKRFVNGVLVLYGYALIIEVALGYPTSWTFTDGAIWLPGLFVLGGSAIVRTAVWLREVN